MKNFAHLIGRIYLVAALGFGLPAVAIANQADLDAEIARYREIFSGSSFSAKKAALHDLAWAGVSSAEVYDPLQETLLAGYNIPDSNKAQVEQISWLAKGIAVSGNAKYQATLATMLEGTPSKKLKKHITTALQRLPNYEIWNPVISANLVEAPAGRLGQARALNMLDSDIPELIRAGAKLVRRDYSGEADMLAAVNASLLKNYTRMLDNKAQVDAINFLIRTLGEAGDSSYRPTLEKVMLSGNKKNAKYAKKFAAYL